MARPGITTALQLYSSSSVCWLKHWVAKDDGVWVICTVMVTVAAEGDGVMVVSALTVGLGQSDMSEIVTLVEVVGSIGVVVEWSITTQRIHVC